MKHNQIFYSNAATLLVPGLECCACIVLLVFDWAADSQSTVCWASSERKASHKQRQCYRLASSKKIATQKMARRCHNA